MTGPATKDPGGPPRVCLVVPCFDEEGRLPVERFVAHLDGTPGAHLVFVDDGSRDGTLAVLRGIEARRPDRVRVLARSPNAGKAEAVRAGMRWAFAEGRFDYVGYLDADLATPLEAFREFVEVLEDEPTIDVVMGARVALLGRHIERRALRHYAGRVFATAASVTLELPVYDTQCGAKLFRAAGRGIPALFDAPFVSRWVFDVELLARHLHRRGPDDPVGIYELPLRRWTDVEGSKVRPIDFVRAFGDMAKIYGRYPLRRRWERWVVPLSSSFVRYLLAGGLGTFTHYALLALLTEAAGVDPSLAAGAGASVGAALNYVLNYHFTFTSRARHVVTLPKFLLVALASVLLSAAGVELGTRLGLHYLLSQALCTGVVLVVGFLMNRFWTFRGDLDLPPRTSTPPEAGSEAPEPPGVGAPAPDPEAEQRRSVARIR